MSYTTVKLPMDFVKNFVDPIVEDSSKGFNSRADVIKTAIREYFEKFSPNIKKE